MKKVLMVAVCYSLLGLCAIARSKSDTVLVPHAAPGPASVSERDREHGFVRQVGRPFDISVSMMARDDRTVGLLLKITNASSKPQVFVPAEIVVLLPNGHSYRPYTQTDVMQEAYQVEADPKGRRSYSDRAKLLETVYTTSCSREGESANCPTTADVSLEQWRARRSALHAMTRTAIEDRKLKNYLRAVREDYLESRPLAPGETISGYVDVYVEDVRSGPFTVRIPAGDTRWIAPAPGKLALPLSTYDLQFGPDVMEVER